MPTALQPGENSIDSTKPARLPNGSYALQWRLCYKDGTVKKFTTKHKALSAICGGRPRRRQLPNWNVMVRIANGSPRLG